MRESLVEPAALHDSAWRRMRKKPVKRLGRRLHRHLTHAAEAGRRKLHGLVEEFRDSVAGAKIGIADNCCACRGCTEKAACSDCADAVGKFNFTKWAQDLGSGRTGEGSGLDVDGSDDIVAGLHIRQIFLQHVALNRPNPEVMMGIDDGQVGIENRLVTPFLSLMLDHEKLSFKGRFHPFYFFGTGSPFCTSVR